MRVHLYPHKGPKTNAYILGEKQGLLKLAKSIEAAANGFLGTETVKLYSSDGHEYELLITRDVAEQEWQDIPLPHKKESDPEKIDSIKTYKSLKQELTYNET